MKAERQPANGQARWRNNFVNVPAAKPFRRRSAAAYRQGRVVASTVEEALAQIKEKFPGLERVAIFACPVQPWPEGIWWEWLGKVRGDTSGKVDSNT